MEYTTTFSGMSVAELHALLTTLITKGHGDSIVVVQDDPTDWQQVALIALIDDDVDVLRYVPRTKTRGRIFGEKMNSLHTAFVLRPK